MGKRFFIRVKSAEGEGLKEFLREDGTGWAGGSGEFGDLVGYFRGKANVVEDF